MSDHGEDTDRIRRRPATSQEADCRRKARRRRRRGRSSRSCNLDVKIDSRGACERHITVTHPAGGHRSLLRQGVQRDDADGAGARVPARPRPAQAGRAPLSQGGGGAGQGRPVDGQPRRRSTRSRTCRPISEPDLDLEAVEIPDEGPLTFEFDLEVRPQFDLPKWKGLGIEKPVREFTDEDVDAGACSGCWPTAAGWCPSTGRPSRATTSPPT